MVLRRVVLAASLIGALFGLALPATAGAQSLSFEFGATGGSPPGALAANASGITVDADGNPWVADPDNHRIVKYDYNRSYIAEFSAPIGGGPDFVAPEAIAADASGFLYIVQGGADTRIVKIDTGGSFIRTIGPAGPNGLDLTSPSAIAVDSATGTLYVADGSRIAIYDANGVPTGRIPVSTPTGVAFFEGEIYVAYVGFSGPEIDRFRPDGTIVNTIGLGTFSGSVGQIAVDSTGRVYVADIGGSVVRRFSRDGPYIDNIGAPGMGAGETIIPNAVALDCRNNVYIVDAGQIVTGPGGPSPASKALKFGVTGAAPPPCAPRPPPPGALDLQVNDVEVTQAIQPDRTYTAGPLPPPGPPLFDLVEQEPRSRAYGLPDPSGATEVALRSGAKTVVRVYATERLGPEGGVANVPATLEAVIGGRTLGPIQPVAKPAVIRTGGRTVATAQRTDPAGAYTFELPEQWTTQGSIELIARLNPAGIGCEGPCVNRTTFRLTGVPFMKTIKPAVVPIALTENGVYPVLDAHPVFDIARMITPVDLDIYGFHAQAEVGDIIRQTSIILSDCFLGIDVDFLCTDDTYTDADPEFRDYYEGILMDRVEEAAEDAGIDDCDKIPIGLVAQNVALPGIMRGEYENKGLFECAIGYATVSRPITAVAHELEHAFARPHASQGCGATGDQEGEPWPPDQRGLLGGIGMDTRTGSGGASGPFSIVAPDVGGRPAELFDLMGYCANDGNGWISPRGWSSVIGFRASEAKAREQAAQPKAAAVRSLHVTAIEASNGKVGITGVSPVDASAAATAASNYRVEARDASGAVLATAPATATQLDDSAGVLIDGSVPAPAGTTQVFVWRSDGVGSRRLASATAPKVKLLSPRGGSTVSQKMLTVRWRATDADGPAGGTLDATVEYSPGGGKWAVVQTGPADVGAAQIPRAMLAGSRKAEVRVTVDDGFHEDVASSGRFTLKASPPDVRISDPAGPVTIAADAPLSLHGEAFGPGGVPLRAKALQWSEGKHALGRGETVIASDLKPGRRRITLTATSGGQTARTTVAVQVLPVQPEFLVLEAPPISAKAKTLKLQVATTVAAKLKAGGKSFQVSPKVSTVKVKAPKGKGPFELPLKLSSGGFSTDTVIAVERG